MALRCLTTSILFEIFAFVAKHRIILVVSGVGSFKHVLSKFRFCSKRCRISSGSHVRETSDSTTSWGRATSRGIEEVELLDYPTLKSQLHLQDYNSVFTSLHQSSSVKPLVRANQREQWKNMRPFTFFLGRSWLGGLDFKLLATLT